MLIIKMLLPPALAVFGILWYIHVVKIIAEKTKPANPLLGIALFYGPLFAIIIPLFNAAGAPPVLASFATILTVLLSTVLFTSAVIKKYDGMVITLFMALNVGLFSGLYFLNKIMEI